MVHQVNQLHQVLKVPQVQMVHQELFMMLLEMNIFIHPQENHVLQDLQVQLVLQVKMVHVVQMQYLVNQVLADLQVLRVLQEDFKF